MSPEIQHAAEDERRRELVWLQENRDLFWLVATVAFEEIGRGAIVVDLAAERRGETFSYLAEGELEVDDERQRDLLDTYDPDREFVLMLRKREGHYEAHLGRRPLPGWYGEMKSHSPYPQPDSSP